MAKNRCQVVAVDGDVASESYSFGLKLGQRVFMSISHKLNVQAPENEKDIYPTACLLKEQLDALTVEQLDGWIREIERYRRGE